MTPWLAIVGFEGGAPDAAVARRAGRTLVPGKTLEPATIAPDPRVVVATAPGASGAAPFDASRSVLAFDGFPLDRFEDAWRERGRAAVDRVDGEYAFLACDRATGALWCGRDALGTRGLYWAWCDEGLALSTEPYALLALPGVDASINRALVARYLEGDYDEPLETVHRAVMRVEPGCLARVDRDCVEVRRHWQPVEAPAVRFADDAGYDAAFVERLDAAVLDRIANVPGRVGILLSGGLDSSAIAIAASRLARAGAIDADRVTCVTLGFEGLPCDERALARAVAERSGFTTRDVPWRLEDARRRLEAARDAPEIHYTPVNAELLRVLGGLAHDGVEVLLSGVGGDELLAPGCHHLADLLAGGCLSRFRAQLVADAALYDEPAAKLLVRDAIKPLVPASLRAVWRRLRRRRAAPFEGARTPMSRFASHAAQQALDAVTRGPNATHSLAENHRLGARFGIEFRYPFLDRRVAEFLLSIPWEQRHGLGETKRIVRRAFGDALPEAVARRADKADFGVLIDREVLGPLSDEIEALIRTSALADLGVVDRAAMLREWRAWREGPGSAPRPAALSHFIGLELEVRPAMRAGEAGRS